VCEGAAVVATPHAVSAIAAGAASISLFTVRDYTVTGDGWRLIREVRRRACHVRARTGALWRSLAGTEELSCRGLSWTSGGQKHGQNDLLSNHSPDRHASALSSQVSNDGCPGSTMPGMPDSPSTRG
jgi:hypothetical protein